MKKFFLLLTVLACFGFAKGQDVTLVGVSQQGTPIQRFYYESIYSNQYCPLILGMLTDNTTTQDWQIGTVIKYEFSFNGVGVGNMLDTLDAQLLADSTLIRVFELDLPYHPSMKALPDTNYLCVDLVDIDGAPITGVSGCVGILFNYVQQTSTENDDASLSSLSVKSGTLTPAFRPDTLSYVVNVPEDTTSIVITATTTNPNATVSGTGTQTLNVGQNVFSVVVTAVDGTTTRTYTVTVNRGSNAISSTNIENVVVYPNPTRDNITVDNAIEANVSVYNIAGQQLINVPTLGSSSEKIDVSNLAAGIYVVKVQNGNAIKTEKIQIIK